MKKLSKLASAVAANLTPKSLTREISMAREFGIERSKMRSVMSELESMGYGTIIANRKDNGQFSMAFYAYEKRQDPRFAEKARKEAIARIRGISNQ